MTSAALVFLIQIWVPSVEAKVLRTDMLCWIFLWISMECLSVSLLISFGGKPTLLDIKMDTPICLLGLLA